LDVASGIALCSILLMNITGFGLPFSYVNSDRGRRLHRRRPLGHADRTTEGHAL
jgi:uncharacterized membrane protein YeiB